MYFFVFRYFMFISNCTLTCKVIVTRNVNSVISIFSLVNFKGSSSHVTYRDAIILAHCNLSTEICLSRSLYFKRKKKQATTIFRSIIVATNDNIDFRWQIRNKPANIFQSKTLENTRSAREFYSRIYSRARTILPFLPRNMTNNGIAFELTT